MEDAFVSQLDSYKHQSVLLEPTTHKHRLFHCLSLVAIVRYGVKANQGSYCATQPWWNVMHCDRAIN